jgi:hypothetical protein
MKKVIVVLCLFIFTSGVAHSATKQEKLTELLSVMNMDAMVDTMYGQMETMMKNMSTQLKVTEDEQEIFNTYYASMTTVMRQEMSWAKMKPMIVKIYDKNFNEQEISEMLAFYKTDTGKSILAKLPKVTQESMVEGQLMAQAMMPKIQQMAEELSQALIKSRKSAK